MWRAGGEIFQAVETQEIKLRKEQVEQVQDKKQASGAEV